MPPKLSQTPGGVTVIKTAKKAADWRQIVAAFITIILRVHMYIFVCNFDQYLGPQIKYTIFDI